MPALVVNINLPGQLINKNLRRSHARLLIVEDKSAAVASPGNFEAFFLHPEIRNLKGFLAVQKATIEREAPMIPPSHTSFHYLRFLSWIVDSAYSLNIAKVNCFLLWFEKLKKSGKVIYEKEK